MPRIYLLSFLLPAITAFCCSEEPKTVPTTKKNQKDNPPPAAVEPVVDEREENLQDAAPAVVVKKPMFLEFTSDTCLPCKLMEPWIKELKKAVGEKVEVVEINIDRKENRSLVKYFGIRSVPVQIVVDGRGAVVARNNGIATFEQMKKMIEGKLGIKIE